MNTLTQHRFIWKPIVFIVCAVPAALVVYEILLAPQALGANPIEEILDRFGNWALRFMMIALAVTPMRRVGGWNWLPRYRRMLGLFAFFYAFMHFLTWYVLDQEMRLEAIVEDLLERPFITVGFIAVVILTALAATSTAGIRRRMGRRWQSLHNLVYIAAILGVWHYWWQVKKDITEPLIYAAILSVLLGLRIWWSRRPKARAQTAS